MLARRTEQWSHVERSTFDVAVIGAGINGASVYHHLCRQGYRVILVDERDFAGRTSQSSAMMIWGGLLYLAQRDFATVREFCADRDRMIDDMPTWVRACANRFVATSDPGRSRWVVLAALYLYWALGGFRRARPRVETSFPERAFLLGHRLRRSLVYEEAIVEPSDARFTLEWILPYQPPDWIALNHCSLRGGAYDASARVWRLELADRVTGKEAETRARWVVNAAGVWTDELNDRFGIASGWKHVFGKGVFLGLVRHPAHRTHLVFENREDGDCMSLIPWGPISLWGPTETTAETANGGFRATPEDVRFLLDELNRHLARPAGVEDIVSLRCGVRPLAVPRSARPRRHTLGISRKQVIVCDPSLPWISLYGGKLTGCAATAQSIVALFREALIPSGGIASAARLIARVPEMEVFPGLTEPVISARHAADHEMCWTLDDYLRRRTNVSQWVPRGGLGRNGEHVGRLGEIAALFAAVNGRSAEASLAAYRELVDCEFDQVLRRV